MKKNIIILSGVVLLTACSSGIPQEDYDKLAAQVSEAAVNESDNQAQYNELNDSYQELQEQHSSISSELESVSSEYDAYKESMQEYEGLSLAEAESRKIEAESIVAASAAAEEAARIAEAESIAAEEAAVAASIAAEEARGYETGITYNQLARTPDDYEGQKVKFSGKVVQVLESGNSVHIRLAVNKNYDTILYGTYSSDIVSSRILDDDIITVYGVSTGLKSYQSTLGATITIPEMKIDKIDQ